MRYSFFRLDFVDWNWFRVSILLLDWDDKEVRFYLLSKHVINMNRIVRQGSVKYCMFWLVYLFILVVLFVNVCLSLFTWVFWFMYLVYFGCVVCQCVLVFVYLSEFTFSELTGCLQICVLCSVSVLCSGWFLCCVVVFWLVLGCELSLWVEFSVLMWNWSVEFQVL